MYIPSHPANRPTATPLPQQKLWEGQHWHFGEGLLKRYEREGPVFDSTYHYYLTSQISQNDWTNGLIKTNEAILERLSKNSENEYTIEQYIKAQDYLNESLLTLEHDIEELFHIAHHVSQKYHKQIFNENWCCYHLDELHKKFEAVHTCIVLNTKALEQMEKDLKLSTEEFKTKYSQEKTHQDERTYIKDEKELQKKENAIKAQKEKIQEFEEKRTRLIDAKIAFVQHLQEFGAPLTFPQLWTKPSTSQS